MFQTPDSFSKERKKILRIEKMLNFILVFSPLYPGTKQNVLKFF